VYGTSTLLAWYDGGKRDGKYLVYLVNTNTCERRYYVDGMVMGTWEGNDMSD